MEDLKAPAWMIRYGARSLADNLAFIPADREQWKPAPEAKSALEIAAEAVRVFWMYLPLLEQGAFPERSDATDVPIPATLAEAGAMLTDIAERYAAALESAGAELDRPQPPSAGCSAARARPATRCWISCITTARYSISRACSGMRRCTGPCRRSRRSSPSSRSAPFGIRRPANAGGSRRRASG